MKVEYFRTKNWNISKRNMELFEDRVQPDSLRYNSYLLLCMDNNLDNSFERKIPSTGWKLQLILSPI